MAFKLHESAGRCGAMNAPHLALVGAGGVFPLNESSRFRVPSPDDGLERTMNITAGRKRHSAEDIVRKLRRADEVVRRAKLARRSPPPSAQWRLRAWDWAPCVTRHAPREPAWHWRIRQGRGVPAIRTAGWARAAVVRTALGSLPGREILHRTYTI
jgi:hypothetical protein